MMRLTKLAMALLLCAATSVAQQQIAFTWNDLPAHNALPPGALDARLLPRLIQVYRSHGIQFVSLEEATKDPFYGKH